MFFPVSFIALLAPLMASGLPVKRAIASSDLLVLKFANVLEQLETQFYTQALQKFQDSDFTSAGFTSALVPSQQFQAILSDESTHTTVLQSTIEGFGEQTISTCKFDFSSVLTDVTTMAAVARLVENVGVGAYLGAAHLVTDPSLLTAAASILTVEARHQTILNVLNSGTAIPQAFDIPLLPQEVLALAGPFISGCDVGIPALPPLKVTNTGSVTTGTSLSFSADTITSTMDQSKMSCQMLAGGLPFSISLPFSNCVVPPGITGPVAIWVTNDTQPLQNNARDRFTGNIVAGPTMAFIDNKPEALGQLARNAPSGSNPSMTQTISPSQASSVAANAGAAPSSSSSSDSGNSSSSTSTSSGAQATPAAAQDNSQQPGGPNLTTGPSPDGATTVLGWSNVPAPST